MYLLEKDDSVMKLETRRDMEACLKALEDDEWKEVFLKELIVLGFDKYPLFIEQDTKDIVADRAGYKTKLPDIDLNIDENRDCIENGYAIFLSYPGQKGYRNEPTRNIAWKDITDRGGMTCSTMLAWDKKEGRNPLPTKEKAALLTRVYQLFGGKAQVLKRFGKVSGVKSSDYVVLPAPELIPALEETMKKEHPEMEFFKGSFSHEYLQIQFLLHNKYIEDYFKNLLTTNGVVKCKEVKAGVRFSTSDVGNSSVQVNCFVIIVDANDHELPIELGSGIKMAHKNDASIELFKEQTEKLGQCFKDSEYKIEQLGNLPINNPAKVIMDIREKYTIFPKAIADNVSKEYALLPSATGIDVYLAFMEIIDRANKAEQLSPTKYLEMCESAAKIMLLPMDAIDNGKEWKKI